MDRLDDKSQRSFLNARNSEKLQRSTKVKVAGGVPQRALSRAGTLGVSKDRTGVCGWEERAGSG